MSSQTDDFYVVEEVQDDVLDQLRETVSLFGNSIVALNQSTVLLKDELQRTLSAALQRLEPDKAETTEEILKAFHKPLSKANDEDEIRRNYIKRICARLVSGEAEKQRLEVEYNKIKAAQTLSNTDVTNVLEHQQNLQTTSEIIDKIENLLSQLTINESSKTDNSEPKGKADISDPTLTEINGRLNSIYETILQLVEQGRADSNTKQTIERSWYDMLGDLQNDRTSVKGEEPKSHEKFEKNTSDNKEEGTKSNDENMPHSPQEENKNVEHDSKEQQQDLSLIKGVSETQLEDLLVRTLSRVLGETSGSRINLNTTALVLDPNTEQSSEKNAKGSDCSEKRDQNAENRDVKAATAFPNTKGEDQRRSPSAAIHKNFQCPLRPPFNPFFTSRACGMFQEPRRPTHPMGFHERWPFIRHQRSMSPQCQSRFSGPFVGPRMQRNVQSIRRSQPEDNKKETAWIPDFIFD